MIRKIVSIAGMLSLALAQAASEPLHEDASGPPRNQRPRAEGGGRQNQGGGGGNGGGQNQNQGGRQNGGNMAPIPGPGEAGLQQWCSQYRPGDGGTTIAQIRQLQQAERFVANGTEAQRAMDALQAASARETIPALYRLLSDPNTKLSYGSFNDPKGGMAMDRQRGLRVVFQLELDVARPNQAPDKRLLSAITFWRYKDGRMELTGGPDAIRVRSQIVPTGQDADYAASSSFDAVRDPQTHQVAGLSSVAHFQGGNQVNLTVPKPADCMRCHNGFRNRVNGLAPPALALQNGYRDFIQHYRIPRASPLRAQMTNPIQARRLFTSGDLVNMARNACLGLARSIRGN